MDPSLSLNVHLAVPQGSHTESSHTPNTPEILNSIVNMTNGPFANYPVSNGGGTNSMLHVPSQTHNPPAYPSSSSSNTSRGSLPEKPGLSVQQYCSQFIKEGLKMKVKRKLGAQQDQEEGPSPPPPPVKKPRISITPPEKESPQEVEEEEAAPATPKAASRSEVVKEELLSPDDMAKRLRRRERNKLAATKCRNKKKAQYTILAQEHDDIKRQNASFKSESARLEIEKRKLTEVLDKHRSLIPNCPLFLVKSEGEDEENGDAAMRKLLDSSSLRRSCSFTNSQQALQNPQQQQQVQDYFLGKSAINSSFYDYSSRCMAM